MKRVLRTFLERRVPSVVNSIRAIRHRQYFKRRFSELHAEVRRRLFPGRSPILVQRGPFEGMHYFDEVVWGSITPKWLGSYEAELHPIIAEIRQQSYRTVIDVGSAEGYYAVGLALILSDANVFAFDTDFLSRRQVARLAGLNAAEGRVHVRSLCTHAELEALAQGETLVVCDIEGFETELLNPAQARSLLRSDVLVEIHEESEPSVAVEALLRTRFDSTHTIRRIEATSRTGWLEENTPHFQGSLDAELLLRATDESRVAGRVWFWMRALSRRL